MSNNETAEAARAQSRAPVIRAMPDLEFRAAEDIEDDLGPGYLGLLRILFSPVGEWTEINSVFEGRFLERFAPGAWKKTIRENAERIRSLFQHGQDPQIGDKPLGPFHTLEENDRGGYAEVKLLDTSYNRDLLPGLQENLYGASHRFRMIREIEDLEPGPSEHNPQGLPERTVKEAKLFELGPVTFPAYQGATAGMRSMTDDLLESCFHAQPDRLREMFDRAVDLGALSNADDETDDTTPDDAPSEDDAAATHGPHLTDERRETTTAPGRQTLYGTRRKESKPWLL